MLSGGVADQRVVQIRRKPLRYSEINASFYSWPTPAGVIAWVRPTGRRKFVFTVKVCELITHVKRFIDTETLVLDFGVIGDLLGDRMGCFLFKLPPSFHYSTDRLEAILSQLNQSRRSVVEFRHASWWNENVFAAFGKTGTIFGSCSAPKLSDALITKADDIYVRFHGKDRCIAMIILKPNCRSVSSRSRQAAQNGYGCISTMTMKRMPQECSRTCPPA